MGSVRLVQFHAVKSFMSRRTLPPPPGCLLPAVLSWLPWTWTNNRETGAQRDLLIIPRNSCPELWPHMLVSMSDRRLFFSATLFRWLPWWRAFQLTFYTINNSWYACCCFAKIQSGARSANGGGSGLLGKQRFTTQQGRRRNEFLVRWKLAQIFCGRKKNSFNFLV